MGWDRIWGKVYPHIHLQLKIIRFENIGVNFGVYTLKLYETFLADYDDIYDKVYTILSESPSTENYKKADGMIFIHHHLYKGKRKTLSYTDKEANIDFTMTLYAGEIKISFKLPIFTEFMNNVNLAIQDFGFIDLPHMARMRYGFDDADCSTYKYSNFDKMLIEELCKRFSATVITDIIKKLFANKKPPCTLEF